MIPYEVLQPGGSIEYSNDEAGAVWMRRMLDTYPKAIWLNSEPEQLRPYRQALAVIREIMEARMYPITKPRARDALIEQVDRKLIRIGWKPVLIRLCSS